MNTRNIDQIIANYISRFDELNDLVHREYDKWQIAYKFRPMMDDALMSTDEEFAVKLFTVKKLTSNLIDSYTLPFSGLVEFAKHEPSTVRRMFVDLFNVSNGSAGEKQDAIQGFISESHALRDKYASGSFLFNDDFHSVTAYLFLYDPDHNYLYKASHCRAFADCIEFYDDWGSGTNTRLDVFFRMCDSVIPFIKNNEALAAIDNHRNKIDPDCMHLDSEKHILLFDLIYSCSAYGLFDGIDFDTPKSDERKAIQEKHEKALILAEILKKAETQLSLLNEATAWLNESLKSGVKITHKSFGDGVIKHVNDKTIEVSFTVGGNKTLGKTLSAANGLIAFIDSDLQEELLKKQSILLKEKQIREAAERAEKDFAPFAEYV